MEYVKINMGAMWGAQFFKFELTRGPTNFRETSTREINVKSAHLNA